MSNNISIGKKITDHINNTSTTQQVQDVIKNKLFRVKPLSEILRDASKEPDPRELYFGLIYENEIVILFADTGKGKTVFAVQITNEISKKIVCLYVDLELSDKQFEKRYRGEHGELFEFNQNFFRADMTRNFDLPDKISYEDFFIKNLSLAIEETNAKFVVIDNLTKLTEGETDSAKRTLPIMNSLAKIKDKYGLTLLILEHTKKVDTTRPIHLNDLQGSKMKANFADSIISIGVSASNKNERYIKQLKVRSAEYTYDADNVLVAELIKENGFLQFKSKGTSTEIKMLRMVRTADNADGAENADVRSEDIMKLYQEGTAKREIGRLLGISEKTVRNIINNNISLSP